MIPESYITTQEAAKRSGLSDSHIRRLIGLGMLPGTRKFGDIWMIPIDSLEKYIQSPRKRGRKPLDK